VLDDSPPSDIAVNVASAFCYMAVNVNKKVAPKKQGNDTARNFPPGQLPKLRRLECAFRPINRMKPSGKWDTPFIKIPQFPDIGWSLLTPNLQVVSTTNWGREFQVGLGFVAQNLTSLNLEYVYKLPPELS